MNQTISWARRFLGLTLLACTASCSDATGLAELTFPDGDYELRLFGPRIVNPLSTPTWMGTEPRISVTKAGDELIVTASSDDLIVLGPAPGFGFMDEAWGARFEWQPSPTHHYWVVRFTAGRCITAEAVDADLGIGPGGVWTVTYTSCSIQSR